MSATVVPARTVRRPGGIHPRHPGLTLMRQSVRDSRVRTVAFASLFAVMALMQPIAYRTGYRTLRARLTFAHAFGANLSARMFYGQPRDLLTVDGYTGWRVGGTLAIVAAAWGLLAAVRVLRTEEETGRTEMILAGPTSRRRLNRAGMAAAAADTLVLGLVTVIGLVAAGISLGGAAYLAVTDISVACAFLGVGALVSQLAPSRRFALELGGAVVALMFVLRVVADTAGAAGLRWLTPLGWAENMRPLTGARPWVLILPALSTLLLLWAAARLAERRDIGTGTFALADRRPADLGLLSSATAQALRGERGGLIGWTAGVGAFGVIIGALASSTGNGAISKPLAQQIAKLGAGSIATPAGYLGLVSTFFILTISLFGCAQIGAARREEAEGRLETLLAEPVARVTWLAGRIAIAGGGIVVLSLVAALCAWAGAAVSGAAVPLLKMVEAGINFMPVSVLFLAIASCAYAAAPRAAGAITYCAVIAAFIWQMFGSLLNAPGWLVNATPFDQIGLVPAVPAKVAAGLVMLAIAAVLFLATGALFGRRDLTGA